MPGCAYGRTMIKRALFAALLAVSPAVTPIVAHAFSQEDVVLGNFLPGWQTGAGTHMAALHVQLAPEWKTYWRAPGDTGIPPVFDWSGSENLKAVRFHWPRPSVFHVNGMQSIGYHHELVLPIEVTAINPDQPILLRARIDIGVCKDICVPASFELAADLNAQGQRDPVIVDALSNRPTPGHEAGLIGIGCTVEPIKDGLRITAALALPSLGGSETVVFESGLPGVWVSESTARRDGSQLVAVTEMVPPSGAPFALDRSGVTVTVIAGGNAVEISGCPAP